MDFRNKGLGAIKDKPDSRDYKITRFLKATSIPDVVDYEAKMTPVKDQAQRGACVAFATAAMREYQAGAHKKAPRWLDLSEEWIYEQVRQPGGGAMPRDALTLLDTTGVCKEWQMRYRSDITDDIEDTVEFKPRASAVKGANDFKSLTYARLTTVDEMTQSLAQHGPFIIGVDWLDGWFNPSDSVQGYPIVHSGDGTVAGGHALCVVGYDLTIKALKIKNSWGESFGRNGYFFMSFDAVNENLNDAWSSVDQ